MDGAAPDGAPPDAATFEGRGAGMTTFGFGARKTRRTSLKRSAQLRISRTSYVHATAVFGRSCGIASLGLHVDRQFRRETAHIDARRTFDHESGCLRMCSSSSRLGHQPDQASPERDLEGAVHEAVEQVRVGAALHAPSHRRVRDDDGEDTVQRQRIERVTLLDRDAIDARALGVRAGGLDRVLLRRRCRRAVRTARGVRAR